MVSREPKMVRMTEKEHQHLKDIAAEFRVPLGEMVEMLVSDARQRNVKVFVDKHAHLIPDNRLDIVIKGLSCIASFLEQQEGLNDSRGYLKLARKKIEEAEFFGEGGSQDDPVLERVAEEEKNEHSD